jgi:hypothetical protein
MSHMLEHRHKSSWYPTLKLTARHCRCPLLLCHPAVCCHNAPLIRAQAARGIGSMLKLVPPGGLRRIDTAEYLLLQSPPTWKLVVQYMCKSSCKRCRPPGRRGRGTKQLRLTAVLLLYARVVYGGRRSSL